MPRWLLQRWLLRWRHPTDIAARWELEERRRCARCVVRWRVRAGGVLRSGDARAREGTFARSASWSEALEAAGFLVAVGFFAAGIERRSALWLMARCE